MLCTELRTKRRVCRKSSIPPFVFACVFKVCIQRFMNYLLVDRRNCGTEKAKDGEGERGLPDYLS